jgi:hypothetical protein
MAIFSGFSASDFAAFEEKKWGSNAFTLERMKVRDKLAALQDALAPVMAPHAEAFAGHLTDEHPNIMNHKRVDTAWLYYTRTQNHAADLARFLEKTELKPDTIFNIAPQEKHVALAIIVDNKAVHVGLFIHPGAFVDRRNFAAKLEQSWNREKLKQVMEGLDPELTLGFDDTERVVAREMELPAFTWLAETLASDERRFSVARTFSAEEAITMGSALGDTAVRMLTGLVALYDFVAWTRANDQIQVAPQIQKAKIEQRKNSTEFKPGDKVKIAGGMFAGKVGNVQSIDTKAQVKVVVGKLSVNVAAADLSKA